jgi:hypothetical protein
MVSILPYVPYLLIAGGFIFLLRLVYRSNSPARPLLAYSLIGSLVLDAGITVSAHYNTATSKSSTAAVGYIFLPSLSLVAGAVGFLLCWCLVYLGRFVFERIGKGPARITSGPGAVAAFLVLFVFGLAVLYQVSQQGFLNVASASTDVDALQKMVDRALATKDIEALSALAKNPSVPVSGLLRIYDSCKSRLNERNILEYDVFLSLAGNPQAPPTALSALAGCRETSVRIEAAMNPSTPRETLWQLSQDASDLTRYYLARNPSIPKELLLHLAKDPDRNVRDAAGVYLEYRGFSTGN